MKSTTQGTLSEMKNADAFTRGLVGFTFAIFALVGMCASAMATTLDDITYAALSGDRVQVTMKFSEPLQQKPVNFSIDNPARIAVDLPGVGLNLKKRSQPIGIGMVHSYIAVQAQGRTRVVIDLIRPVAYQVNLSGNDVVLTLGSGGASAETTAGTSTSAMGGANMPSSSPGSITNVDFHRGSNGEGRVVVTMSNSSIPVNMTEEGGQIVVDFAGANLPSDLNRRLDVVDFATPVKDIDMRSTSNGARMIISTNTNKFDHMAYQTDNKFTVEVSPLTAAEQEQAKQEKFGYTGQKLSLNFQNIQVRAVLQLIADFTGFNLVVSDSVNGSVTLRLKNVPWDQALDIILKSRGLGMKKVGNVMMVAPQEELAAREKLELESQKQVQDLAPLHTEFIQINYAKAADLAALIRNKNNNLLSKRGNVSIDTRTNTLIVQDVASSLEAIRKLVAKLDVPIRQVLIESRIVNADESFSRELGVKFGYSKNTTQGGLTSDGLTASAGGTLGGGIATTTGGTTTASGGVSVGGGDGLMVNLPAAGATSTFGLLVGKIGSYLLQLELSALLAEGRGQDIASPKVITANQKEAVIESGVEIPFQQATSSGATSVSFKKAVLSLRVTPQITPDNRVLLDLNVTQDTRGSPDVLGVPPINTRNVSTQVLVNDGETVVLGGIYSQTQNNTKNGVPFFSNIPILGFLFKSTSVTKDRTELLIFVTPKILKQKMAI